MMAVSSMRSRANVDVEHRPPFDRRRQVHESPEPQNLSYTVHEFDENEHNEYEYQSDESDYDLEAFGPVDVDPTLTESEWLRSQGIDPDEIDNDVQSKEAVAVLSLAEVSYSRDIGSVNKAERERHIRAANALWGAQAAGKRPSHPPRPDSSFRGGKRPGRGRGKGGRPPHSRPRNPLSQGPKPSPPQIPPFSLSLPNFPPKQSKISPENPTLRPNARVFIPMTVSIDGMNPNAPAFIPGFGFKS